MAQNDQELQSIVPINAGAPIIAISNTPFEAKAGSTQLPHATPGHNAVRDVMSPTKWQCLRALAGACARKTAKTFLDHAGTARVIYPAVA